MRTCRSSCRCVRRALSFCSSISTLASLGANAAETDTSDATQTADRASLEKLAGALAACDPPAPHHLWVEQPEDVPTCLALAPNRREGKVKKALDKAGCRLWKG